MPVRKIRASRIQKRDQNELALRDQNGLAFCAPFSFSFNGGCPASPNQARYVCPFWSFFSLLPCHFLRTALAAVRWTAASCRARGLRALTGCPPSSDACHVSSMCGCEEQLAIWHGRLLTLMQGRRHRTGCGRIAGLCCVGNIWFQGLRQSVATTVTKNCASDRSTPAAHRGTGSSRSDDKSEAHMSPKRIHMKQSMQHSEQCGATTLCVPTVCEK